MTRPYSTDLRARVLARMDAGETIRSLAEQFNISPSCIPKWKKLRDETGSITPCKTGGGKKRTLSGASGAWMRERIHSGSFSLRKLVAELAERGIKTDRRAVYRSSYRIFADDPMDWSTPTAEKLAVPDSLVPFRAFCSKLRVP